VEALADAVFELLDRPLPEHPYKGDRMPEGYEGPR